MGIVIIMKKDHTPVLPEETIDYLDCKQKGIYIDGTAGRGGHIKRILQKIGEKGLIIGVDRDQKAIKFLKNKFKDYENIKLVHDNYINIPDILEKLKIDQVDGMLFDLGFSSPQIDTPERGFSYQKDGPLDMRMNQEQNLKAADIVNKYSQPELAEVIREYGEDKWAERIAEFIVKFRNKEKIETTSQLVEIIKKAIPAGARRKGGHPARRTFQALRIETNNELNQLQAMIDRCVSCLKTGGRICIISFHSLEDRIVKHTFRELAKDCVCPPDFPICNCDKTSLVKIITKKPVIPSKKEIDENPRARSAKLRVVEKKEGGD